MESKAVIQWAEFSFAMLVAVVGFVSFMFLGVMFGFGISSNPVTWLFLVLSLIFFTAGFYTLSDMKKIKHGKLISGIAFVIVVAFAIKLMFIIEG